LPSNQLLEGTKQIKSMFITTKKRTTNQIF
jgi:hypothetical protein